eukprot:CAMPEP_0113939598 /NCGR_PEP_ID=MMETSP1339-20121228/5864_1 /TAXON_ID=94617 /ORGANISM="Fibrocapsa japonica" /LENGTH=128 /DNA_ID=CAMNT_0000943159 /DNA_START=175 /DNA_END=561 /DNA_ORIENTATION=- /assembly_acc=CAM_ASM_000762
MAPHMKMEGLNRQAFVGKVATGAAVAFGAAAPALAVRDYEGVKYLGGGDKIDVNNANIRAYLRLQGMYPSVASKIVNNGPFTAVSDLYNIPGLTGAEKEVLKKYESRLVVTDEAPEYAIDKINNGLYR